MFHKAIVAVDLYPADIPLLDCMPGLRDWGVTELVLTHVMPVGYMQGLPQAHEEEYQQWLEKHASRLRDAGFTVEVLLRSSGRIAEELLQVARERKADLLVVGSRGHNRIERMVLGSVARQVIQQSELPVLLEWIEPTADAKQERCEAICKSSLQHILLATDFSENSAAAEGAALFLASRATRIDCIHILPSEESPDQALHGTAMLALDKLQERIREAGSTSDAVLLQGKKASVEISRNALEKEATLIVVGKHGQSHIASKLIGSTAANICEKAGRPVLLVP